MFILRNAARTILLAVLVLNSGLAARGDDKPLSMRDIARMRHQRLSPDKIVEKATEQGVSFAVTPGNEKQLGRLGFTPEQIDAIKEAVAPRAKAEGGEASKPAAIVPGQGLKSSDAERDGTAELVAKITKLSAAEVQPVASKHVTLWAAKGDRAAFMPDIKKIETFLEGKCREPLRSGLDKRSAHLVLLKTRYDYEKWTKAMFELMPERFKLPDAPGGDADLKASILKWTGYYSQHFVVICMEGQEDPWLHHMAAAGVGFMNFVQQVEPQRHDPLSTGFANGVEALATGSPQVMLFSNSYHNEDRDLGNDPRAWLHLVQERMRRRRSPASASC